MDEAGSAGTGAYALFSPHYPPHLGGIENFTQNLAAALARRGNDVIVVTNDTEGLGSGLSNEDGVKVLRLPCIPLVSGRFPVARHRAERRRLLSVLDAAPLAGVLVNARFYPHSLLGMRVARAHGLTPVVLDHGSAYLSFSNPALDPIVRCYERLITAWGRRYGAAYYGISEKSVDWLKSFGIEARGVINNSIDAVAYREGASARDFRSELGVGAEQTVVAFVGRLIPEKGVRALIEASRDDRLAGANATIVLAGDGPLADEVRAAEGATLRWLGRLSREDTAALLLQSDLLCLPSRSEGFSTTLLEASACGCPSLVTDVGGAQELIPDQSYGRIMSDASVEQVVSGIVELASHRDGLVSMGERCRARVEGLFSWDEVARRVERECQRQ